VVKSKSDPGIPADVIEIFGPPAVLPHRVEDFYRLLNALAQAYLPREMADWCKLWDIAMARTEVRQIASAKLATIMLHRERAAIEIVRADSLRFVGADPHVPTGRDISFDSLDLSGEAKLDLPKTYAILDSLELSHDAVLDVAYILASPILAPLEALSFTHLAVARAAAQDLERRHERLDRRNFDGGAPAIVGPETSLKQPRIARRARSDAGAVKTDDAPGTASASDGRNAEGDLTGVRQISGAEQNGVG
jgi:hypothetical protein